MNLPIQNWEQPEKDRGITINGEGDRLQQELSTINEQYRDTAYGIWVLAYEDSSDSQYKEVLDRVNDLKNLCIKLTKEKYNK